MHSLVIELYNLVAVLLQVVQMFNFIFVTLYSLGVGLLEVHIFHCIQLLFMIKHLVNLEGENKQLFKIQDYRPTGLSDCGEMFLALWELLNTVVTLLDPPRPIIFRMKNCFPLIVMDSLDNALREA